MKLSKKARLAILNVLVERYERAGYKLPFAPDRIALTFAPMNDQCTLNVHVKEDGEVDVINVTLTS